jgi:hypothetical protein
MIGAIPIECFLAYGLIGAVILYWFWKSWR